MGTCECGATMACTARIELMTPIVRDEIDIDVDPAADEQIGLSLLMQPMEAAHESAIVRGCPWNCQKREPAKATWSTAS